MKPSSPAYKPRLSPHDLQTKKQCTETGKTWQLYHNPIDRIVDPKCMWGRQSEASLPCLWQSEALHLEFTLVEAGSVRRRQWRAVAATVVRPRKAHLRRAGVMTRHHHWTLALWLSAGAAIGRCHPPQPTPALLSLPYKNRSRSRKRKKEEGMELLAIVLTATGLLLTLDC